MTNNYTASQLFTSTGTMGDTDEETEAAPTPVSTTTLLNADEIADRTVDKLMTNPMFKTFSLDIMSPLTKKIKSLETKVEQLEGTVFDLQKDKEKLTKEHEHKDAEITVLQESLGMDRDVIIDLQQAQNKNMLMISGVPEKKKEINSESASAATPEDTESVVIELVKEKLGIEIKEEDIDRSYRTKDPHQRSHKPGTPCPIFVKFTRYNIRKIIKSRRLLRGTGIGMSDVLTYPRAQLYRQAQGLVKSNEKVKACWTWDGYVQILVDIGEEQTKKVGIGNLRDLQVIAKKYGVRGKETE